MSTRGAFRIRKNGEEKALYIPCDAYPSYSAPNVISLIREADLNSLFDILQHESFSDYYWFDAKELMDRSIEKRILPYKDDADFIKDSLMCEYAYVINLDDEVLEYYVGFQKEPQVGNRYGEEVTYETAQGEQYYPCRLIARFTFGYIKKALVRNIVKIMENDEVQEEIITYDTDEIREDNMGETEFKPTIISIYKKLEWIEKNITSTMDKHMDIQSRFEQGLRDIDKIKTEMTVYRMEISSLQYNVQKLLDK